MKPSEWLSRLNGAQQKRSFKLIASAVIVVLAIAAIGAWIVLTKAPDTAGAIQSGVEAAAGKQEELAAAQARVTGDAEARGLRELLGASSPTVSVAIAIAGLGGAALIVTWLGLALTYLGLMLVAGLVAAPLYAFDATRAWGETLLGALALTASFTALLQALRALLGGGRPIFAIARNTLSEAVRMKISVVFIVLLIFFLAGLPFFLDADQPLRYRVQLFLQYGIGGSFWVLALLTVFFSIATVAFEQRDKIIWQTITKPVRPWQYLFGKWLGVVALNGALLAITGAGVFLFTQRLRYEPAMGEIRAYVSQDGPSNPSIDRVLLESQVLTARASAPFQRPEINEQALDDAVEEEVQRIRTQDPDFAGTARDRALLREAMRETAFLQYRTIPVGAGQRYTFEGLGAARDRDRPITLRYKINAGADNPSTLYRVYFVVGDQIRAERQVTLNTTQTFELPGEAIDDDGMLRVEIWNGNPMTGQGNPRPITISPDEFEILYVAGGYELNYLRILLIVWMKLAFISAVAIAASTFLSFPVACVVSMGVLFLAESSAYLVESLDWYVADTKEGFDYIAFASRLIAVPISWAFSWYGKIDLAGSLADGRLIGWGTTLRGAGLLAASSMVMLGLGWLIFRKRELALYSGK